MKHQMNSIIDLANHQIGIIPQKPCASEVHSIFGWLAFEVGWAASEQVGANVTPWILDSTATGATQYCTLSPSFLGFKWILKHQWMSIPLWKDWESLGPSTSQPLKSGIISTKSKLWEPNGRAKECLCLSTYMGKDSYRFGIYECLYVDFREQHLWIGMSAVSISCQIQCPILPEATAMGHNYLHHFSWGHRFISWWSNPHCWPSTIVFQTSSLQLFTLKSPWVLTIFRLLLVQFPHSGRFPLR